MEIHQEPVLDLQHNVSAVQLQLPCYTYNRRNGKKV